MKNWNSLLGSVSVLLLLSGGASAQTPPPQATPAPPVAVPAKPAPAVPQATLPVPMSPGLERLLATPKFHFPADFVEWMRKADASAQLSQKGDLEAGQGNWTDAVKDYGQALTLSPDNSVALYGLGDDSLQHKDVAGAVSFYRRAIYSHPDTPTPPVFQAPTIRENNAFRVMEYARILSMIGQQEEAVTVYQRGAQMLNYMDGHPHLKLMLPDFGDSPGQVAFTPQRLQALAQVGWAEDHSDFDKAGAGTRLQQAVALFPDSPVPYFYRARYEARHGHDFKAVKADFDKAAQMGGGAAADAVQQEEHFFRHQLEAVQAVSEQTKSTP